MTEHRVRSAQRRAVFERARGCCEYCRSQARFSTASFAAEHIVAIGDCNAQTGIGDPYLPFREVLGLLTGDVEAKLAQGAITQENASRLRNSNSRYGVRSNDFSRLWCVTSD